MSVTGLATVASLVACGSNGSDAEEPDVTGPDANGAVSDEWQEIVDLANDEGQVNLYNVASEVQNSRLEEMWSEAYPEIQLNITRGAAELPTRVAAELESGTAGADVFQFSNLEWYDQNEEHLADISQLPSNDEGWNEDYVALEDKAIVASTLPWSMVAWNTDTFPNGFHEWEDLLDPSVEGQLGTRGTVTASVAGYLDFLETELGEDYMFGLGEQDPAYYASGVPLMQAVASGEVGVANAGVPATAMELQEQGAPIDFTYMEPGFAFQIGSAAFTEAGNPNAALVFMDWFMSEEGQYAYNGDGYGGAGRDGVDGALALDDHEMLDATMYPESEIPMWEEKLATWFD